jgi:hypothetical protein
MEKIRFICGRSWGFREEAAEKFNLETEEYMDEDPGGDRRSRFRLPK